MRAILELLQIAVIFVSVFFMVYGIPLLFALLIRGIHYG